MKKIFSALAVLTAFALIATSCSDDKTTTEEKIPVSGVTVTPATGSVVVGTTLTLEAKVLPENATIKTVEWISRTPELASVDKVSGVVTGIAVGEAEIWAVCDGKNAKATITVTAAPIRVESVTLSKEAMPLFVGKSEVLIATVTPDNATDKTVVWTSSDTAVATVAENGTVTGAGVGTATITATADEKSATCEVTVSIADISDITMTNMDAGSTITMTATGFLEGDKVRLEALVGDVTAEATVKNVTAANAQFDLPAACTADRSYKVTVMRGAAAKAEAFLRPNNEMVRFPYELGYYMTGVDELVPADPNLSGSEWTQGVVRRGYLPGKIFVLDDATKEFIVWKADAKLCPATITTFELTMATGVKNLDPLKGCFDMSSVTTVIVADSYLTSLDMTIFPNVADLLAWGNPGGGVNLIETVNFGTRGVDPELSKLNKISLERQSLKGVLDLRNCPNIQNGIALQDNQLTGVNFGVVNVDPFNKTPKLNLERNQIREFSIENCGRIRNLQLAGNPMERLTLLNNARGGEEYMYLFKGQAKKDGDGSFTGFSLTWASAAEAQGERVFNVENYWWRVFSASNGKENTDNGFTGFEGGWIENGPIVQAQQDGVKIICWTYHGQNDGTGITGDSHIIPEHTHDGGASPCPALP